VLGSSISKNSILLGLFALTAAGMLAGVNEGTKERIEQEVRAAQQRALYEIVPQDQIDNDLLMDTQAIPVEAWDALGLPRGGVVHVARQDGEIVALIIPAVAPDGYSGEISMIVGVNSDGTIAGVRVLSHKETPGLGDKLELNKSNWVLGFNNQSLQNPEASRWKVKKDGGEFDQFTGATITPRAVVHQVKRVLEFVAAHEAELFARDNTDHNTASAETIFATDDTSSQGVTHE
jgi:electron transport complex protein RnfG